MNSRITLYLERLLPVALIVLLISLAILGETYFHISSELRDRIILITLGIMTLVLYNHQVRLESSLDELMHQIAEGNPDAVFKVSDRNARLVSIANKARSDLLLVGPSFVGFLSTESHVLIQSLEKGLQVRVVLLDSSDEILLDYASRSIQQSVDTLQKDVEYSVIQLDKVRKLSETLEGSLEVRVVQSPLTIMGLQVDGNELDGTLLFSMLSQGPFGMTQAPYFMLNRRTSKGLFDIFSASLEAIWSQAAQYRFDVSS